MSLKEKVGFSFIHLLKSVKGILIILVYPRRMHMYLYSYFTLDCNKRWNIVMKARGKRYFVKIATRNTPSVGTNYFDSLDTVQSCYF